MATDVRLDEIDGTYIVLQSRAVKSEASDFLIDAPDRRKNQHGARRALVHDQSDGLTVNFNRDYPGGVTLMDVAAIFPMAQKNRAIRDITPALPHLTVHGGITYEVEGLSAAGKPAAVTVSIDAEFSKLQDEIQKLTQRVAALEALKP